MLGRRLGRAFAFVAILIAVAMAFIGLPTAQQQAQAQDLDADTIAEIAAGNPNLSFLTSALSLASENGPTDFLAAVSDPDANLTVFAPTNAAFLSMDQEVLNAAINDPGGLLTQVLSYHVLATAEDGASLVAAGTATTLEGTDVTITARDGGVFINDSEVTIADVPASNGIVHVIDAVLVPGADPAPTPTPEPVEPTIADIALANDDLTTLVAALSLASETGPTDFLGAISNPNADLTVFAPTNAAFAAMDQEVLNAALNDPNGLLTQVLAYHVVGSSENGAALVAAGSTTTLAGTDVTVELRDGNVFINNSQVVIADVQASNGIVHVIDAVLLPGADPTPTPTAEPTAEPTPAPPSGPTIAELATNTSQLSTLVTALTVASEAGPTDFLALASDPNQDLTVFAPTNAAFDALGADTLNAVLADASGALTDILSYHVLGESLLAGDLITAGSATTLQGSDVTVELRNGRAFINDSLVITANVSAVNGVVHIVDAVLLPTPVDPGPTPEPRLSQLRTRRQIQLRTRRQIQLRTRRQMQPQIQALSQQRRRSLSSPWQRQICQPW